jgi:hypothetical protein
MELLTDASLTQALRNWLKDGAMQQITTKLTTDRAFVNRVLSLVLATYNYNILIILDIMLRAVILFARIHKMMRRTKSNLKR